ncbi:butyrophilin subfamily 2 member A2-like [Erinaceus europaeus]|uniref:Butyrophilin subfamily 2 member A2-like n=1 Tax=Erinaceus europaeus TaxID=9365 RepID=A0A1S3AFH3_ERIEU|nr:butyrophilin subfamily 2 member A2-like [Erinaceus europaeus]
MEMKIEEDRQKGAWGQFSVVGPGATVIASVGEEAVLHCHLSPETDAENMEVTWDRMDPPALVHHYAASQDQQWLQSPQYRGRTEFLKENINTGQVALRIHPILPSDGGEYRCNFVSSTFVSEAQVEVLVTVIYRIIKVAALGTAPQIHIESGGTGEVKLTCTSRGWYPEPEVQWRDLQGLRFLEPASETKTVAKDGLFQVQTSVTVDTRSRDVSCGIINPVLSEEKEAHVSMAGSLPRKYERQFKAPAITYNPKYYFSKELQNSQRKLQMEIQEVKEAGLSVIRRFAANITLDQDTAHPYLKVSENRKYVRNVGEKQDVPDNSERFDTLRAILGENSFSAGDHYWEVDVSSNTQWETGLCVESVERKGGITVCPENGFWALSLRYSELKTLTTPPYILKVSKDIQIVGIFLQYEKGLISFYNVTECSLIYTFKSTFTEPLKPYFYHGYFRWGMNMGLQLLSCQ